MAGLQPIRAIERGISVMRVLEELGTASLHQLHEKTGLHRTTLLRILDGVADLHRVSGRTDADVADELPAAR